MRLKWYGQSFFRIVFGGRNGTRVVIDPYSSDCGLKVPTLKCHLLLISHSDYNNSEAVRGDPFVVDAPGEYEVKNAFAKGIPAVRKGEEPITMFRIEAQGFSIVHLADLNQEELSSEQLESIGSVDVLLIPIGGKETIGPSQSSEIITQIEPKVVIPMKYNVSDLKPDLAELDEFLEVMGEGSVEAQDNFEVKATNLPEDGAEVVVLEPEQ